MPIPTQNAFFRVCTINSLQGATAAEFALKLGLKTAYIIDENETYGLDRANVFETDYQKGGGTVLGHDHVAKNTQDFKSLLTKIAATKPALVFYGGTTSTGAGLIRQQMFDAGLGGVAFMGGDGIADIATVAAARADGTYYTVAAPNAEKLPSAQAFIKAYQAAYHQPVGPYSANAFASAQVAIAAIEAAIDANAGKMPNRAQGALARRGHERSQPRRSVRSASMPTATSPNPCFRSIPSRTGRRSSSIKPPSRSDPGPRSELRGRGRLAAATAWIDRQQLPDGARSCTEAAKSNRTTRTLRPPACVRNDRGCRTFARG